MIDSNPTNDAPVQPMRWKTDNSWVDQNWQKAVAWLWDVKVRHGKARFTTDSLHAVLGEPPSSRDMNTLMSRLKAAKHIEPTMLESKSTRRKARQGLRRVWRVV